MIFRKLIDWVKSEEAKGLNDTQVKKILLQKGWPAEDINLAVNLAHKNKVNWMPFIVTFILVFVFALTFGSIIPFFITFITTIFGLLYALIPYYKSNKQENYLELFVLIFTSSLFSLVVSIIFFNISVLITSLTGVSVTIPLIIILPALSIILLFYIFFFTISKLSKHFVGYFDYESYFVYKHWPFKILNVNWTKKWTLLKYPVILIIIGLVVGGIVYGNTINRFNRSENNSLNSIQEQLTRQLNDGCFKEILKHENLEVVNTDTIPIKKVEQGYLYDQDWFKNRVPNIIYYDCQYDTFSCQNKPFNPNLKLGEQITFNANREIQAVELIITPNKVILFAPSQHSPEELVNCPFFSEKQLQLESIQDANQEKKDFYLKNLQKEFPKVTWSNYAEGIIDRVVFMTELGLNLGYFATEWNTINYEFHFVENESAIFYDGTTNLNEHIIKLKSNIEELYPQFLAIPIQNAFWEIGGILADQDYSYKTLLSVEDSFDYLLSLWAQHLELELKINNLRNNFAKEKLKFLYGQKDVLEPAKSKAVRLKIIETIMAKELTENCQYLRLTNYWDEEEYNACIAKITDITQSPEVIIIYA